VNSSEAATAGSAKPSILVAEDHADSREALRALLEASGYRVLVARNGREAIDAGIEHQPDLVLMDIMMPEVDGFEATRTLRATDEFRQVPIVALTAMEGARPLALAAGCDDYLPKPIDVRTFLRTIAKWLEAGRTANP
jgi:CheY-like chemotaxis protein